MTALNKISSSDQEFGSAPIQQLRNALDTGSLLNVLRRDWTYLASTNTNLLTCDVERVHTQGKRGFVIEYRMGFEGHSGKTFERVFGQLPGHDPEVVFHRTIVSLESRKRRQLPKNSSTNQLSLIPALGLILRFPGIDEKITGLRILDDPQQFASDFSSGMEPFNRAELLAHRLGRRSVVRLYRETADCKAPNGVIVKLYKQHSLRTTRVVRLMRILSDKVFSPHESIRLPTVIREVPAFQAITMEKLPGTPLCDLPDNEIMAGMALAGRALGRLHNAQIEVDESFSREDEIELLYNRVSLAVDVMPELTSGLNKVLGPSVELLEKCRPTESVLLHRDFHEKQLIVDGSSGGLIDLDTACMGDPAQDVGNFLAHLKFLGLQTATDRAPQAHAFLDGYRDVRSLPAQERIHAHIRSTLLRMACIYAFSSKWRHLLPQLLDED